MAPFILLPSGETFPHKKTLESKFESIFYYHICSLTNVCLKTIFYTKNNTFSQVTLKINLGIMVFDITNNTPFMGIIIILDIDLDSFHLQPIQGL